MNIIDPVKMNFYLQKIPSIDSIKADMFQTMFSYFWSAESIDQKMEELSIKKPTVFIDLTGEDSNSDPPNTTTTEQKPSEQKSSEQKPTYSGYVYCLSNPAFAKNMYKIGKTTRKPEDRAAELYNTGVPAPFKVELAIKVSDHHTVEKQIHEKLDKYRDNPAREFFNVPFQTIREVFDEIPGKRYIVKENIDVSAVYKKIRTKCDKQDRELIDTCTKIATMSVCANIIASHCVAKKLTVECREILTELVTAYDLQEIQKIKDRIAEKYSNRPTSNIPHIRQKIPHHKQLIYHFIKPSINQFKASMAYGQYDQNSKKVISADTGKELFIEYFVGAHYDKNRNINFCLSRMLSECEYYNPSDKTWYYFDFEYDRSKLM